MQTSIAIRRAGQEDWPSLWPILEPVIRAGETYALPRDMSPESARAYWFDGMHSVWLAEEGGAGVGTYQLRANQRGPGSHFANAGFMTAQGAQGKGVARTMGLHALETAKALGFRAMQFNFVVSTNLRAVRLWQSLGFQVVGTLPGAFQHPQSGFVDVFVMVRTLIDVP